MKEAIDAFYSITASSEFREMERLRSKACHDEAQALRHARIEARQEGKIEGRRVLAKNFMLEGVPLETIVKATGLSRHEVEECRLVVNKENE